MHRTIENPDDEVLNQENLAEGFFFANFLPLTCEKFRSSPKRDEGLKSCHDRGMNLDASAWRWGKRVKWKGAPLKLGEFL